MNIKLYGIIYGVKKKWNILFYRRVILLVTDIGIIEYDLGPLYTRREKLITLIKLFILSLIGYAIMGYPGLIAMSSLAEESVDEIKDYLVIGKEYDYKSLTSGRRVKIYLYNKIRKIHIDVKESLVKIRRSIILSSEYIVDPRIIEYIPNMLSDSGLEAVKYEYKSGQ